MASGRIAKTRAPALQAASAGLRSDKPTMSDQPTPAVSTLAAADEPKSDPNDGSIKETIEAILVAFILAFIFRGFVVEAFVIPTGSMAPTLLGAHMRFTCDDCGYQFDVNYNTPGGHEDDIQIPSEAGANPL